MSSEEYESKYNEILEELTALCDVVINRDKSFMGSFQLILERGYISNIFGFLNDNRKLLKSLREDYEVMPPDLYDLLCNLNYIENTLNHIELSMRHIIDNRSFLLKRGYNYLLQPICESIYRVGNEIIDYFEEQRTEMFQHFNLSSETKAKITLLEARLSTIQKFKPPKKETSNKYSI